MLQLGSGGSSREDSIGQLMYNILCMLYILYAIYIRTHTHTHTHTYIHTYICMYACEYTYINKLCMYVCMYVCIHTHTDTHGAEDDAMCIRGYWPVYVGVRLLTRLYVCVCVCVCARARARGIRNNDVKKSM
jgi:hypothetical protein